MDAGNSIRRQAKPKTPGERTSSAVMEPPYDTEEMGEPSATGNMPGEGMQDAAMGAPSAPGKMPGEGMRDAGLAEPPATGNMPGEKMQDAAMGTPPALGNMPGGGMQGAAMGAPSATGKMPGDGMQGAAMGAPPAKMPARRAAVAEKPVAQHHVLVKPGESLAAAPLAALGPYKTRQHR